MSTVISSLISIDPGVHTTSVTASQSMPVGQLSMRTMAGCYNCCAHSRVHSVVCFVLVMFKNDLWHITVRDRPPAHIPHPWCASTVPLLQSFHGCWWNLDLTGSVVEARYQAGTEQNVQGGSVPSWFEVVPLERVGAASRSTLQPCRYPW